MSSTLRRLLLANCGLIRDVAKHRMRSPTFPAHARRKADVDAERWGPINYVLATDDYFNGVSPALGVPSACLTTAAFALPRHSRPA